jgi:hypothetical protein
MQERELGPGGPGARTLVAVTPVWAARGVVAIGAVAALTLVGESLGLGVALVALALGELAARVRSPVAIPGQDLRVAEAPPRDRWVRVWWVLAAALACVPVLRAAPWVVVPALVASAALASLAATGGRRWGQLMAGLGVLWARLPAGPVLTAFVSARGIAPRPALIRGLALAGALLAVFVPLLMSADAAFAELLERTVDLDVAGAVERALVAALVLTLGGALLHVKLRPPNPGPLPAGHALGATESNIALGALVSLFATFVALQFATLFGGSGYVLRTAGLTYAEYARSGFAQLLAVAVLTFAVLAAGRRWARPHRALEVALCLLTLVVLASALRRLGLYEETYGFTRLRFAAHAGLLYLGALFALVLFTRAPQALVAVTAAAVLAFALSDPERRIAEHNVARYERTGKLDVAYLETLGADAAPALAAVTVPPCVGDDGIAGFNLARAAARRTSTDRRTGASGRCDPRRPSR